MASSSLLCEDAENAEASIALNPDFGWGSDADRVMMVTRDFASANKSRKTAIAFSLPCCW